MAHLHLWYLTYGSPVVYHGLPKKQNVCFTMVSLHLWVPQKLLVYYGSPADPFGVVWRSTIYEQAPWPLGFQCLQV